MLSGAAILPHWRGRPPTSRRAHIARIDLDAPDLGAPRQDQQLQRIQESDQLQLFRFGQLAKALGHQLRLPAVARDRIVEAE